MLLQLSGEDTLFRKVRNDIQSELEMRDNRVVWDDETKETYYQLMNHSISKLNVHSIDKTMLRGEQKNEHFHQMNNRKARYTSKSDWTRVKALYEKILDDEFTDTDYWYGPGRDEQNILLSKFDQDDWDKLREDVPNWQNGQVEILSIILNGCDEYLQPVNTTLQTFRSKKSELYSFLLYSCDEAIFIDLVDDLNFIKQSQYKDLRILTGINQRLRRLVEQINATPHTYSMECYEAFFQILEDELEKARSTSSEE